MATVTRSEVLHAGPLVVWEQLADFGAIDRWAAFVEHASLLRSGPLEPGLTRRIQMGRTVVLERLVEVDPPRALEYAIEGLPARIASVRNRWMVEADEAAGSRVSIATTVTIGPRPPQQLAERVLGRILARRSDEMLAGLAHHLESNHV